MPRFALLPLLVAAAVAFPGCSTPKQQFASYGGMREVMRLGKTEPRVALQQFVEPGTYGLGALAGLQGEILIEDGQVWVARAANEVVSAAADDQATLLVVAQVPAWREVVLTGDTDLEALERALAAAVPAATAKDAAPLPFVVVGNASRLAMHVVRGYCPHGEPTADAPPPDSWSHEGENTIPVRLVGVFAPGRAGSLTHHGTALHVHALVPATPRPSAMGHVDAATLAAGSVLRIPAAR